jgi:hypothetical protein
MKAEYYIILAVTIFSIIGFIATLKPFFRKKNKSVRTIRNNRELIGKNYKK